MLCKNSRVLCLSVSATNRPVCRYAVTVAQRQTPRARSMMPLALLSIIQAYGSSCDSVFDRNEDGASFVQARQGPSMMLRPTSSSSGAALLYPLPLRPSRSSASSRPAHAVQSARPSSPLLLSACKFLREHQLPSLLHFPRLRTY